MRLLRINEIHLTNIKVAECRAGAQVSVAMVNLPLLVFGLFYIQCDSCLHRPVAFWGKPDVFVVVVANEYLHSIMYNNTTV